MSINIEQKFPYNFTVKDRIYENIDSIEGAQPYFYYQQGYVQANGTIVAYRINYGYYYLLRRILCSYADRIVAFPGLGGVIGTLPNIFIELSNPQASIQRQNKPIPINLISSPGNSMIDYQPEPGIMNMRARPLKYSHVVNNLYRHGNDIVMNIVCDTGPLPIDIMFEGYLIPEKSLEQWS